MKPNSGPSLQWTPLITNMNYTVALVYGLF